MRENKGNLWAYFGSSALALRDKSRLPLFCSFDGVCAFDVADAGFAERPRDVVVDANEFNDVDELLSSLVNSFDGVDARESLSLPVLPLPSFFGFGVAAFLFLAANAACCFDKSFCLSTFASLNFNTRVSGTHSSQLKTVKT